MEEILHQLTGMIYRDFTSQVVQDFFHQQYDSLRFSNCNAPHWSDLLREILLTLFFCWCNIVAEAMPTIDVVFKHIELVRSNNQKWSCSTCGFLSCVWHEMIIKIFKSKSGSRASLAILEIVGFHTEYLVAMCSDPKKKPFHRAFGWYWMTKKRTNLPKHTSKLSKSINPWEPRSMSSVSTEGANTSWRAVCWSPCCSFFRKKFDLRCASWEVGVCFFCCGRVFREGTQKPLNLVV